MDDPTRRNLLKAGAAAAAMAAMPRVFAQQAGQRGTGKFYEKGPVRIRYEEAGAGFPLMLPGEQNVLLAPVDVGGSLPRAFQRADTLKDLYTDGEAQELFELGRQMVIKRWRAIQVRLDDVAQKSGLTE